MENVNFLVNVRCMTFNHAPYIEDAMRGFCMQETTFPFVCTIIDDASTDGEPEVINKYLQEHFDLDNKEIVRNEETDDYIMTFAQHKTNNNCYFAVYYLKYNHYSIKKLKIPYIKEWYEQVKYEALCEGDDYWIVNDKIQKQIDILKENTDVSIVYTSFKTVNEKGDFIFRPEYEDYKKKAYGKNEILSALFHNNYILTLTVCYKRSVLNELYQKSPSKYDYNLFLSAGMAGLGYYLPIETGCYRKVMSSMMNTTKDSVNKGLREIFIYYASWFIKNPPPFLKRKEIKLIKKIIAERIVRRNYIKEMPFVLLLDVYSAFCFFRACLKRIVFC